MQARILGVIWTWIALAWISGEWVFGQAAVEQPRTVVVNVLAYSSSADGKATGSCTPVRVTAGGSEGGQVRVGFFETEVGGTGAQWRSAGWMAAVTSALFTDFDPRTMRVSFEFEGKVDGPSAGGLMTVGVLAAVRGDDVRPDAAMTGTINPDGTIGPVGGIPHKIDGAVAKGMKLVLIPASIRFDRDNNTGQQVDLVEHGRKLGVEVRPVFDIFAAYEALTGKSLPRPPAAPAPRVGDDSHQRVLEKMRAWYDRYETSLGAYQKLSGPAKLSQEALNLFQKGVDIIRHSEQMKSEGEFSAALWDRIRAAAYGYTALEMGRCRHTYASTGYGGLVARIRDNGWLEAEIQATAKRMRNQPPKTLDQLSMYLFACDAFLEAVSLQTLAKAALAHVPAQESEAAIELAFDAAQNQIFAWIDLQWTSDLLDLTDALQGTPIPAEAPWRQTADYLRRASEANLSVFDALIVEPRAKGSSLTADQYKAILIHHDKSYATVQVALLAVFPRLKDYFGDGESFYYGYLATSIYTHSRTAGLLAKYYSLGAELDEASQVVRISKERTLGDWLTYAEDQSRRNIAVLQSHGIDATPCAQSYEIARIKARRDVTEKFEGLVEFWSIDLHSQILRRISGAAAPAPAAPNK